MRRGVQDKQEIDDFGGMQSIASSQHLPTPLDESGCFGFPIETGGTFMDVVQRAARSEWLLKESASLCHAAGVLAADDVMLLKADYITVEESCF